MRNEFNSLKLAAENLSTNELIQAVDTFTQAIVRSDSRLITVGRSWSGYGTWVSSAFVNEYYFGRELAVIIAKALTGRVSHNEDTVFSLEDFSSDISDAIYNYLY